MEKYVMENDFIHQIATGKLDEEWTLIDASLNRSMREVYIMQELLIETVRHKFKTFLANYNDMSTGENNYICDIPFTYGVCGGTHESEYPHIVEINETNDGIIFITMKNQDDTTETNEFDNFEISELIWILEHID